MRTDTKGYTNEPATSSRKLSIEEGVCCSVIDATRLLVQSFHELVDESCAANQLGNGISSITLSKMQDSIDEVAHLSSRLGRFTPDTAYWVSLRELSELVTLRVCERHSLFGGGVFDADVTHRFVDALLNDVVFTKELDGVLEELAKLTPLSLASSLSFCNGESTYVHDKSFSVRLIGRDSNLISVATGEAMLRDFVDLAGEPSGRLETFRGSVGESVAIVKVMTYPISVGTIQIAALKVAYLVERRSGERAYGYPLWQR